MYHCVCIVLHGLLCMYFCFCVVMGFLLCMHCFVCIVMYVLLLHYTLAGTRKIASQLPLVKCLCHQACYFQHLSIQHLRNLQSSMQIPAEVLLSTSEGQDFQRRAARSYPASDEISRLGTVLTSLSKQQKISILGIIRLCAT